MSCIPPHFWTPPRRGLQKMYILLENTPQNYNKKMTYANNMSLFFIFFVFLFLIGILSSKKSAEAPFLLFVAENGTDEGKELFVMIGVRELCSPSLVKFHEAGMGLVAINNECFATGL